jgi:hypothetical protein
MTAAFAPVPISARNEIPALRVAVTSVSESRNSSVGRGTVYLNLSIVGEGLPTDAVVKQIKVTKAIDDLGHVLGSSPAPIGPSPVDVSLPHSGGQTFLDAPVRKAKSLEYAEGTIDVFLPSETNGSIIRIKNILSHAGRLEDPALAKYDIEFYFLPDQASYDEAKKQGAAGFLARATPPNFPNGVGWSYRDPQRRLASVRLQDVRGTALRMSGKSGSAADSNRTETIRLPGALPADAQLVFFLLIPEAIKTVPFRVEDIALP